MPTDIRQLNLTWPTPAANLACDEALLNDRESRGGPGVLRFWESADYFIVVGYAARVAEEANLDVCRSADIPLLRRCSGGGTVVQGPGCLNYSLILPIADVGGAGSITDTNRFVMERHRAALTPLAGGPVHIAGHTDLAVGDRKFSGNAQRRKREWFLFHGTFLTGFDLSLIERLLPPPPRQPEYRRQRRHMDFLTQLPATSDQIKQQLVATWNAPATLDEVGAEDGGWRSNLASLVRDRYEQDSWNLRQ